MFDRFAEQEKFTTIQKLLAEGAPLEEKRDQMIYEAGLSGYQFLKQGEGWQAVFMTPAERGAWKQSLVRDGDMLMTKSATLLSEVLRGPVTLSEEHGVKKILVPTRFGGQSAMIVVTPITIRSIIRGDQVIRFYDDGGVFL